MERNVIYFYELMNDMADIPSLNHWDKGYFQIGNSSIVCIDKSKFIDPLKAFKELNIPIGPFEFEQTKVKYFLRNIKKLNLKLMNIVFTHLYDEEIKEELINFVNMEDLVGIESMLSYLENNEEDIEKISFYHSKNKSTYEITKYGIMNINANRNEIPKLTDVEPIKLIVGLNSFPILELEQ